MRPDKQDKFRVAARTALLTAGAKGAGLSVSALARELGLARESVSRAINKGANPGVRVAVAKRLGLPIQ